MSAIYLERTSPAATPEIAVRIAAKTWFTVAAIGHWIFLAYILAVFYPPVAERGLAASNPRPARLSGYRLVFNKVSNQHPELAHANVMFARDSVVEGVLYDLASNDEILKMDPFERAPWNYGRDVVALVTDHGTEFAWTYFANRAVLREDRLPPRSYTIPNFMMPRKQGSPPYTIWSFNEQSQPFLPWKQLTPRIPVRTCYPA